MCLWVGWFESDSSCYFTFLYSAKLTLSLKTECKYWNMLLTKNTAIRWIKYVYLANQYEQISMHIFINLLKLKKIRMIK